MDKKILNKNIVSINRISSRIPKNINEAINFESAEDDDLMMHDDFGQDDELDNTPGTPVNEPQPAATDAPVPTGESEVNVEEFIASVRKSSLKIMAKLADNPDDAVYQFAKKIFQLADKAHEDEKEGKDINGQPKQNVQQPVSKV